MPGLFDSLLGRLSRAAPAWTRKGQGRVVDVGWLLDTDKARFIWEEPRRVRRDTPAASHAKSVNYCPAVLEHEARLFEVTCPIDLRLRLARDAQGKAVLQNADGDQSSIRNKHLGNMLSLVGEREWRRPDVPIIQIITPYIFLSDEPVYMTQLPPYMHYRKEQWPGVVIGGRLPIHAWLRPMMWALEWHETDRILELKRGEPWFYTRFEPIDPSRPVRLVEAERTADVDAQIKGATSVANYVSQTSRLYKVAEARRPDRLLVAKRASGGTGDGAA